jgi:hypothetical protein
MTTVRDHRLFKMSMRLIVAPLRPTISSMSMILEPTTSSM